MNSPRENEEKLRQVLNAWKTLAPDKVFAGMTVQQYEAFIAPSFTSRQELEEVDDRRAHLINTRNDADKTSLTKTAAVVAGVEADPNFGPDSSLIEAMGRVRTSERKSGLTKKSSKASAGGSPPAKPTP